MTRPLQLALGVAAAIVASFALRALRAPAVEHHVSVRAHETAPEESVTALVIGGGYDPESNQISIEDDLLEAASFFAGHVRVLFAGGSQSRAVQVANNAAPVDQDDLERTLGDLFSPRAHRDAHFVSTRLSQASELSSFAIRRSVAALEPRADKLFLYFTGHGSNDGEGSLFHLWGEEVWSVEDMRNWMVAIHDRVPDAQQQLLVTSCFGGGFVQVADLGFACAASATTDDRESSGCDPNQDRNAQEGFGKAFWSFVRDQSRPEEIPSLGAALRHVRWTTASIDVPILSSETFAVQGFEAEHELGNMPIPLATEMYANVDDSLRGCAIFEQEIEGLARLALPELQGAPDQAARCLVLLDYDWHGALKSVQQSLAQLDDEQADETAELDERMAAFRGSLLARYPVLDDPWHPEYREMLARNRRDIQVLLQSAPTGPDLSAMVEQQDQLLLRSAQLERAFWLSRVVRAQILWRPTPEQRVQLEQLRRCEETSLPVTTLTPS